MIQLAYTSTATWAYTETDIEGILASSRRNNERDSITGILLYRARTVLQIIEGPSDSVHRLYLILGRDGRHHDLTLLYDQPIIQRQFPEWSMGFELVGSYTDKPSRSPFVLPEPVRTAAIAGRAGLLLETFVAKIH